MPLKFVSATELRKGSYAEINNAPCIIKSINISKTGKHGASKVRIEALGVIDEKKKIVVMPGSEKIAVPMIEKKRAQLLSINKEAKTANVMDLETFESFELQVASDIIENLKENENVEYWIVEGEKIIKRQI